MLVRNPVCIGAFVSLYIISSSAMSTPDFFPQIHGNLTKITWAHAVNSKEYLDKTLDDATIMMIEADIVLGKVDGTEDIVPIMGHPPATTSDLSLDNFLSKINAFNDQPENQSKRKGVKLDFKSMATFEKALEIIDKYKNVKYPLWINADILQGPVHAIKAPFDPSRFLLEAKKYPNSLLSLGWTTNYGGNITKGEYTEFQIREMETAITTNSIAQDITFPVRAGLAAESLKALESLLQNLLQSTLTLWSHEGDNVDVENLRNLIKEIGVERVYVDVPKELRDQLHLDDL